MQKRPPHAGSHSDTRQSCPQNGRNPHVLPDMRRWANRSDGGWRAITRLGHAAAALAPRITFEHDAACQTQDVSGTFKGNLRMRNSAAGLLARRCSACTHGCYLLRQPCGAAQAFYHSPEYRHAQREQCVGAGTFNLPCAEGMWVIRNLSGRLPASH